MSPASEKSAAAGPARVSWRKQHEVRDAEAPARASGSLPELTSKAKSDLSILVIDDEAVLRESCATILEQEGYTVTVCGRAEEALSLLQRRAFDIALIDLYMTQIGGLELLHRSLELHPEILAIMMTGNPSVSSSIEALRSGAFDYLPKPFSASHLQVVVGRAAHTVLVARETEARHRELTAANGDTDGVALLGQSQVFRRVITLARRVAPTNAPVFITGESGTGKELIAQFIHRHSRRSSRSFVAVNCAALPEALLESEMFGHTKGAFTGAIQDKPGLLETANGGTFFLDELTEMSLATQAKLLRVIQDGVVRRVGSTTTDAVVAVRFIAATNRDPKEAVHTHVLRQDLYYRLRVIPIVMPPLRERVDDIPILARHFLLTYWRRHRERGSPPAQLTDRAILALQARPWTGNVRELQNVIEHAVVLAEPGAEIGPDDLPSLEDDGSPPRAMVQPTDYVDGEYHEVRERLLSSFERTYLERLVNRTGGNMSEAARVAGVDRTTLYRLMDKHNLTVCRLIRKSDDQGGGDEA